MGIGFCVLYSVPISKYFQSIASIEDLARHYQAAELIALSSAMHQNEKLPPPPLSGRFSCVSLELAAVKQKLELRKYLVNGLMR